MNFLDYSGLQRFLDRLKDIIPTKTSDITNDSGYLDTTGVQNYMENGGGYSQSEVNTLLASKADSAHTHSTSDVSGLSTVATSGSYTDLSNTPAIPTKTSELTNDSGFITAQDAYDSALSSTSENAVQNKVVNAALNGKSDTGHTHAASEVSGLANVATSGSYNDLSNTPAIPTVNNATLTIQKNGSTVNTFTANASSNVTANITVPTNVSELTNDSGYLTSASSLDSSKLTGTIDIARLPKGALERLVTVADQAARFALTSSDVQLGDTVKQLDTGVMYIVVDESKLSSSDGYTEYTAGSATSVPWTGVTNKPSDFTPSSHSHGNIANGGTLGTASRALITDSNKKITTSSVTSTELGYVSGVTSAIQTQLDGKAASSHTHTASEVSGLATVATSGSYDDLSNKPTIPTVNNATLTIQKNGSTVKTFTANASSNVTANITVPTKTSELTNDSHQTITTNTDTTSAESPAHSGTFTCIDSVTRDSNGHVTKVNTKTITLPSDNNTDTLMTQNVSTTNSTYPVLLCPTANATSNQGAKTGIFAKSVKINPSTNVISASGFSGPLTGDVTGTASKATGNANGKELTDTVIKGLSISGKTITYTQIDGNSGTLTTQDTVYTHPTTAGNKHVPSGGSSGQFLGWDSAGTAKWVNNPNTDANVTQTVSTTDGTYPILASATANNAATVTTTAVFGTGVKLNPSTSTITATTFSGALSGNASTATQFSANKSVTLTGDVTGTASSKAGWSVATTLANSGVTAGTYGPSADVTGNNNATISVPEITVDSKGRVTSVANRTLTCKNNTYSVYNKTLTIQKNGTNVATFTSNSNTDVTANITVPTKTSELTNDSGYLTSHQSLSNYVTLNGAQTISGNKTFTGTLTGTLTGNCSGTSGGLLQNTTFAGRSFTYTEGQLAIGTTAGKAFKGSSKNASLVSFPEGGTASTDTSANIQNLRLTWQSDGKYLHDLFTSPNSRYFWHRDVNNASARPWRRIVEENTTDVTPPTWDISISGSSGSCTGNAATATQFSANKSVTLTGYINGTASSKAGWSIATALKNGYASTGGTVTNTYFKIASGTLTGGWNRYETLIRFVETTGNASCTLRVYISLDGSALFASGNVTVLDSVNFGTSVFNVVYKNDTDKTLFEIYYQLTPKNHQINALVLYETERKASNICDVLTMYNQSTPVAALPSDYTLLTTEFEKYCGDLVPAGNNKNLGSTDAKWSNVYATTFTGNLTGNVTGNVTGTATKATGNANGKELTNTIIKGLSISGKTITYTQIDGTTGTLTTQDTNTDTLMTQNVSTTNNKYPILLCPTAEATANQGAKTGIFGANALINPSTGEIISKSNGTGAFRVVGGNYGFFIRNDGSNTYFLLTASGDQYGSWTSARPLTISNSTGVCSINGNAVTATNATNNANGKELSNSIIKGLSVSGKTITYTQIDGTTGTITTQDTNTDTLMTQNVSTTNATYPILLCATADATANQGAKTGIFAKSVKVNPSTNVISASGFSGPLTGNVTGNVSGSSGSCTGNSATATTATESLKVSRQIGEGYVDILQTYQSDNNNYRSCTIRCTNGNGHNSILLGVHNESNGAPSGISVTSTNGTLSTSAPTPATADNSTQIATTAFVKAQGYLTSHQSLANYLTKTTNVSEMGRYIDLHYDNATSKYDYDVRLYVDSQGTAAGGGSFKISAATAYAPAPASDANDTRIATTKWVKDKGYLTSHQDLSLYPYKLAVKTSSDQYWPFIDLEDTTTYPNGFNDLMDTGKYDVRAVIGTTPNAPSITTAPYIQGILEVERLKTAANTSSYKRIIQKFHRVGPTSAYDIFIRRAYLNSSSVWVWADWEQVVTIEDIPKIVFAYASRSAITDAGNGSYKRVSADSLYYCYFVNGSFTVTSTKVGSSGTYELQSGGVSQTPGTDKICGLWIKIA